MSVRFLSLATAIALLGCTSGGREQPDPNVPDPEQEEVRAPFRVLSPSEAVPPFRVVAKDGRVFDSDTLVGKRPFIVVFFATWCGVCEMLFPAVHDVFAQNADVAVIGVSLDDTDTWGQVPGYVARHELAFPVVRAESFPRFTLAYDPFQRVPVVAVVGKNGYLIDYQIGYSVSEPARLGAAIDVARRIPSDAPAFVVPPNDDSSL